MDFDKTCFVISPIGAAESETRKHADQVLEYIIKPALEEFGITPVRSDHIDDSGLISDQMMKYIFKSKLCIVVLTGENPNVYYELAVALCAERPVICLLKEGERPRFDIQDVRTIPYNLSDPGRVVNKTDASTTAEFIKSYIANEWKTKGLFDMYPDGPNFFSEKEMMFKAESIKPKALSYGKGKSYKIIEGSDKTITILKGSIEYVENIDVVVNSENVELQLARYYDRSLSGILRYLDAEKNRGGKIIKDHLNDQMTKIAKEIGVPVMPGTVIDTKTNGLRKKGIKYIFHLALAKGAIGAGYENIEERLESGIRRVFALFREKHEESLKSLLFPLIGAGSTRRPPIVAASEMVRIIRQEMLLDNDHSPQELFLMAWRESHMLAFQQAAKELNLIEI